MCAWTAPGTAVTGNVVAASFWNTSARDNLNQTAPAISTAAGDMTYATAANSLARIAAGSTGQILMLNAPNVPSWQNGLPASGFFLGGAAINQHGDGGSTTVASVGLAGYASTTISVSFTKVFTSAPAVVHNANGGLVPYIASIGTSGATLGIYNSQASTFGGSVTLYWVAIGPG